MPKKTSHVCAIVVGLLIAEGFHAADLAYSGRTLPLNDQAMFIDRPEGFGCPADLTNLQPQMQEILRNIHSPSFKNTMLEALQSSIPDAIRQVGELERQMASIKHELARQEQERMHAEQVARENAEDPTQPLKPCRPGQESSYCYAVEQFFIATASNVANQAFVEALECYQRENLP